ncbi:MAG: hypothetical protein CMP22_07995 [Rickettsiales bacterium]|nr:hypothetical protein [Rickettsiales bacterium]|tara:strand:+ start:708 stop:2117 length:1410 start_codon:yes stop_codon:yes gene_type:complete
MAIIEKIKSWLEKITIIKKDDGFTLLEVLLSIGAFSAIAVGFVQMTEDYLIEKKALSAADHMKRIHDAAYEFTVQNFDAMHTALGAVGNVAVLDFDADNDSVDELVAAGFLPPTFTSVNSYGRNVIVLLRNAGNENLLALPALHDRLEIILLTIGDPISDQQAVRVAQNLGGYAGVWSGIDRDVTVPGDTTDDIVGVYGVWDLPVGGIQALLGGNITAPNNTQAHIATYRHINQSDEAGDYLYRDTVAGLPEANRMRVDIDMNNFNVDGVDNLNINGDLTVRNVASFQGVMGVRGNTNINGVLSTDGGVTGTTFNPEGGAVFATDIGNDLNAGTVSMAGATGQTTINTQNLQTNTLETGQLTTQTVSVQQAVSTPTTNILATNIDVSNIVASSGGLGGNRGRVEAYIIDGANSANLNTNGANGVHTQGIDSPGGNLTSGQGQLRIDGPLDVNRLHFTGGANEFHCDKGC